MITLLIATKNKAKVKWFSRFLDDLPIKIVSLSDVDISEDVEEHGKTYKENSQKKALFYAKLSGIPSISDDGGLEIDALNGEPGVKSRRWLGYRATDEELKAHLKKIAENLPDNNRGARYRASVSFALPSGDVWSVEKSIRGIITKKSDNHAEEGFPYDAFFYVPELGKFYHKDMLSEDEHKKYNHRYKAIQKLKPIIKRELDI